MPATYEPIATTTLSSNAANITFSSIGSGYTDLRLILVSRTTRANTGDALKVQFNGITTTTYSYTDLRGDGSAASSGRATGQTYLAPETAGNNATSGIFGMQIFDIFSYAGSTNKTCLFTSDYDLNGSGTTLRSVNLWRSTDAITQILIASSTAGVNLLAGTTATLYGILKA